MEHMALAVAAICAFTGSIVLNKLFNLQRIFKTTYLKFYIASMICLYCYVLAMLVYYYLRFNLGGVGSLTRIIFILVAIPSVILASYLKFISMYKLIGLEKKFLFNSYAIFMVIAGLLRLYFAQVWAANPSSVGRPLLLWIEIGMFLGFMIAQFGLLIGISGLKVVKQQIARGVIFFYICIDITYILLASLEFYIKYTPAEYLIQSMSIVILLNLMIIRFSKHIVLNVNDRKTAENGSNNGNEAIFAELSITPREKEIISLIIKGKSNKDIGDQLCISVHTVKDHTKRIYQKTGVSNRVELTNFFNN